MTIRALVSMGFSGFVSKNSRDLKQNSFDRTIQNVKIPILAGYLLIMRISASPASAREDTVSIDPSNIGAICIELNDTSYDTNISVQ